MNNLEEANQTQFSFEEPIASDFNVELPVYEKPIEETTEKSNKKKKIVIGAVSFFVVLLILVIAVARSKRELSVEIVEEEPEEIARDLGPIEERIENARIDLEIADPSNQDLTFPPVNMELRLDKKEK